MTQVDFYFNAIDALKVTQKLVAKVLNTPSTLVITGEPSTLKLLDDYLWSFDATSFVPHCFAHEPHAKHTRVLLSSDGEDVPPSHYQLLLNLGTTSPKLFSRYTRLLEIVTTDEANKRAGRERYTFYKQRGYPMSHVDLAKK